MDELRREVDGDILVFCSGEREIRDAAAALTINLSTCYSRVQSLRKRFRASLGDADAHEVRRAAKAERPRATAQGWALLAGRDYVVPDDVLAVAGPVLSVRLVVRGKPVGDVIEAICQSVEMPTW